MVHAITMFIFAFVMVFKSPESGQGEKTPLANPV